MPSQFISPVMWSSANYKTGIEETARIADDKTEVKIFIDFFI